jgi:Pyruvate/2-oxoacid:ferredoxin oxidoreductase delta subunit
VKRIFDKLLFDGDGIFYLPRDRVVINQSIERPEDMVLPSRVLEHFIDQASHRWIMNKCLCRDSDHCKDYPIDIGCIFLGHPVTEINPRLGREVTREEALAHVRRAREAGLIHMIGRNKIDTMWLGIQPGDHLMTICNCCPCCCLYQILPHLHPEISQKVTRMPGVEVLVSSDCVGCETCTGGVCFVDAIHMVNGKAVISSECRGCGLCVDVCPEHAIALKITDERFVSSSIQKLTDLVDVS